jgi:DNA (cytosine-5)-methyltransferase 1
MMGLPDGHVTDPAIGISRNDQLKALGNGVVPQQAALALRHLLAA